MTKKFGAHERDAHVAGGQNAEAVVAALDRLLHDRGGRLLIEGAVPEPQRTGLPLGGRTCKVLLEGVSIRWRGGH